MRWGATNKPTVIRRDFKRWPKANLGNPTGAENGFWVLEADTPKGHNVDGIASLRALERMHGRLPKTLMAMSPSGSLHYYFRWPKRGLICSSASKIAPGVDVRGEGGMVLTPPSVKEGVGRYRFLNWGTPIADAPAWLLKLVARKRQKQSGSDKAHKLNGGGDAGTDLIEAALAAITGACSRCRKWPYQVWFEAAAPCTSSSAMPVSNCSMRGQRHRRTTTSNSASPSGASARRSTPTRSGRFSITPNWHHPVGVASTRRGAGHNLRGHKMRKETVLITDFVAYRPMHTYIFLPTREPWPASSVNSQLAPMAVLDKNGKPMLDDNGKPLPSRLRSGSTFTVPFSR